MTINIRAEPLEGFARDLIAAMGAPERIASTVAQHLVLSNLSGHDSHGVLRIPGYHEQLELGRLQPSAEPQVRQQSGVLALIDGAHGFGHVSTLFALDWCLAHAREHAIAAAAIRRSGHIGRLGHYAERAAEAGFLAIVTVGAAGRALGLVAPHGGAGRFLGTNPWSMGFPAAGRQAFVYDAATSAIAEGKVRVARAKGVEVPDGALLDAAGSPTTSPADLYEGGMLRPLGGDLAGHKGYGFSLASALLGGLAMIDDDDPTGGGTAFPPEPGTSFLAGVFVIVIDPGWFGPAERYREMVSGVLADAKQVKPARGVAEVQVAGEPEQRSRERQGREGIEVAAATWQELLEVADKLGVKAPAAG